MANRDFTLAGLSSFMLGIFMLTAGTISIAARKSIGGGVAAACFYFFGGAFVIFSKEILPWAIFSFIFFVLLIISIIIDQTKKE
jgi:hypothetical protein